MGGIDCASFEVAVKWVQQVFSESRSPPPIETYTKNKESFNGILFLKFQSVQDAHFALEVMRAKCTTEKGRRGEASSRMWCNFDLPIEDRVPISFLSGLQRLLLDWTFLNDYIKVEATS